jgi:hypothetical protein
MHVITVAFNRRTDGKDECALSLYCLSTDGEELELYTVEWKDDWKGCARKLSSLSLGTIRKHQRLSQLALSVIANTVLYAASRHFYYCRGHGFTHCNISIRLKAISTRIPHPTVTA